MKTISYSAAAVLTV